MSRPLTSAEEAYWRAALVDAPTVDGLAPSNTSLVAITTAEWADRCRRLFATLDTVRAGSASDEGSLRPRLRSAIGTTDASEGLPHFHEADGKPGVFVDRQAVLDAIDRVLG